MQTPIFIISYNRLEPLKQLITRLEEMQEAERIVIIDNGSTWEPLLEYYQTIPHKLIRYRENHGHLVVWHMKLPELYCPNENYILTDPDVAPCEEIESLEPLHHYLAKYAVRKVGLGLRLDDIPDSYKHKQAVIDWEAKFWRYEVEPGVYAADIDTTFALYDHKKALPLSTANCLRLGYPMVAQHTSWYIDESNLSPEDIYYRNSCQEGILNWAR